MILALGLSRLISSIPYVFDPRKRDWLHALIFVVLTFGHIMLWWRVWLLNSVPTWNILQFSVLIASPLSLYLAATALVSNAPEKVDDWKTYYSDHGQWVIAALAVTVLFGVLRAQLILGTISSWWSILVFGLYCGAALTKRRIVHVGVVILSVIYFVVLLSREFTAS